MVTVSDTDERARSWSHRDVATDRLSRQQRAERTRGSGVNGIGCGRTLGRVAAPISKCRARSRDVPRSRGPPLVPAVAAASQWRYRRTRFRDGVPRVHVVRVLGILVRAPPTIVPDRWPEKVGGRHGHATLPIVVLMPHHPLLLAGVTIRVLFTRVCTAHAARRLSPRR